MKLALLSLYLCLNCALHISADPNDLCGQRDGSSWKWHVQLLKTQRAEQDLSCGGTLLNELFVATAAHCLYDLNGDPLDIGQLRILLADGELRSIKRAFQPQPFDVEYVSNDFVLLLLDWEVRFNLLVGPVCLSNPDEIRPQAVHTPVLNGTMSVNADYTCLNDAKVLFGMIYKDAICFGTFDVSHKYHRNAGSGLFAESRSKWYLVGLVMYTTGPTRIDITYIGGIRLERYLTWIKTTMDHYSDVLSIIERKCQAYMRESNLPFEEHHPIVNLVGADSPRTLCRGALIGPRFVITTKQCAMKTKRVFIHYGTEGSSDWFAIVRERVEPMDEKVALIELDRDVNNTSNVLVCLYSSPSRQDSVNFTTRIAHPDSFVRIEGIRAQYQIGTPLRVFYYCSRYLHHGHFTSPGDVLVKKNADERFYRVMGVLENALDCQPTDYFYERETAVQAINVEIYLPWIEHVVWGGGS